MPAPSIHSKLAKTVENRMLAALRRSKYGYMDFATLIKRAKTDRWIELSKHVYGYMEYRGLVETPTAGNLVALRRSIENHVGMKTEMNYRNHLRVLKVHAVDEVKRLDALLKNA